jgi:prepilin-type processing-associated H-X9-DG protein
MESDKNKSRKSFTLVEIVFTISIIGILLAILLPAMSAIKLSAQKVKDVSNLKKIAEAWKEYTIDRGNIMNLQDASPGGEYSDYGMWFALYLAGAIQNPYQFYPSKSVLNDPSVYISPGDKYASNAISTYIARGSDNTEGSDLMFNFGLSDARSNDFDLVRNHFFSYCTIGNLNGSVPLSTTPLAFTRGLKSDGTWDEKYGLYGTKGGYVVFCDGHVTWFDGSKPVKFFHWNGEKYTTDIRQAVPDVAKIGNGSVRAAPTGKYSDLIIWGNGTGDD